MEPLNLSGTTRGPEPPAPPSSLAADLATRRVAAMPAPLLRHSHRAFQLAMLLAPDPQDLDVDVLFLGLMVHDLGLCETGARAGEA